MTVGGMHRAALLGAPTLAVLSVVGGSPLLAGAGGLLIVVMLASSGQLLDTPRRRLRVWLTHAVTVAVLGTALALFRTARIDAVLIIVMLGVFNRFLLRLGPRDDFIVVGASSVLLVAGTTITPGIGFAVLLALYLPFALWALWSSTMLGAAEHGAAPRRGPTLARIAGRPLPRQRAFIAGASLALMLAGYAVVSLFPRYHFGRFFSAGYFMSLPGAGSSMTLDSGGVSSSNVGAVALRIEPNPDASNAPLLDGLYARQYVLDQFDGRTWSASEEPGRYRLYSQNDAYSEPSDLWLGSDGPNTVKVVQERSAPRNLPHPIVTLGRDRPSYVKVSHPQQALSGQWSARFRNTAVKLVYKVDIGRPSPDEPLPWHLVRRRAEQVLALPADLDPRLRDLAARLTEGQADAAGKIRAVLGHFSSGFQYSLDPLEGVSEDPLVRFLFEARRGHCELYAGAVAVLLRAADVPARVATGYYGGRWNSSGGYLEMSDADAHAWVEAFDPERGWIWIDATPEDLRARRTEEAFAWLLDLYDALEAAWFENVIDFDDRRRRALLERVSEAVGLDLGLFGTGEASGGEGGAGPSGGAGLVALVALALLGAAVVVALVRRRRPDPETLGRRLRAALSPHAPPSAPLGRLLAEAPAELTVEARAAVAGYESLRFDAPDRAPSLEAVRGAVEALERARRRARG